jgi:hypothetical protein
MVDLAVTLPESRPEDDEDVVWGLSTASALWARGERGDAIVWLRRAADAAAAAGQEPRAGELGMIAVRVEQALEQFLRQSMPAPAPSEPSALDRPSLGIEVELEPIPPPPPPFTMGASKPAGSSSTSYRGTIRPPSSGQDGSPCPPTSSHAPGSVSAAVPSVTPPPVRSPAPSSYPGARKTAGPRVPILDPWADEPTLPNLRVDPVLRTIQVEGDEVMVQMRRSPPRVIEEEDGVITSAAPLDHTLRRIARPPTPPTRKWTGTGEQPAGYIADASTGVAPKVPAGGKLRPPGPGSQGVSPPPTPALEKLSSTPAGPQSAPAPERPVPAFVEAPWAPAAAQQSAPAAPLPVKAPSVPPASSPAATFQSAASAGVPHSTAFDPLRAPTLPSVPGVIPRPRSVTVPPPAAFSTASAPRPAPAASARVPPAPVTMGEPPKPPAHALRVSAPPSRPPPAPTLSTFATAPASAGPGASVRTPAPRPGPTSARQLGATSMGPPSPAPLPAAAAHEPTSALRAALDASVLDGVEAFADVPTEMRVRLAALAKVEVLGADEEVSAFGAALIVEGDTSVCATIVDEPVSRAAPGTFVPTCGTFAEAVALRVVAGPTGARVAVWDQEVIDTALRTCPWVLEDLVSRADRLQALAGATMGPLGELDEPTRDHVLARLTVRVARPQETVAAEGAAAALVCVGSVELAPSEAGKPLVVRAGEVLFPRAGAQGARAGAQGAILLVGDSSVAAELAAGPASLASLFASR